MNPTDRDLRQLEILAWVHDTFGAQAAGVPERVRRFIEEAVELAQAENLPIESVIDIVKHVYSKTPGFPAQEVGGVCLCLLAYCAATNVSAEACEKLELKRIQALPKDHFRARHNAKAK